MNHRPLRLALLALFGIVSLQTLSAQSGTLPSPAAKDKELRPGSLDVILLLDKSLSMAPFFEEVKAYAAGSVLGPVLILGDRLIIETVYGEVDRLVKVDIASEDDKAKAIRALRAVKADGRYTDLGAALDRAKSDLDELGQPGRPKYVLLLTDERQEAPKGSPYQATDYKLKHPALEYIKRTDLGKFRAITVGLQVGTKVSAVAPVVMQLLMDPPVRDATGGTGLGGAGAQKASGATGGASAASGSAGGAVGGSGGSASGSAGSMAAQGGATASERALPAWLLYGAAAVLIIALAGLAVALVVSRRKEQDKRSSE